MLLNWIIRRPRAAFGIFGGLLLALVLIAGAASLKAAWSAADLAEQTAKTDSFREALKAEQARAAALAASLAALRAENERNAAAATAGAANRRLLEGLAQDLRSSIQHAPPTDDGPLSPVLRDTLDGLRRLEADARAGADRDTGGAAPGADGLRAVPSAPGDRTPVRTSALASGIFS